uniref:DUF7032 domain-containing protein n=1 Tax=Kalanchoe fedtschenkoi TaxID=63787 RepID=A0A7N0UK79_KALFE
MVKNRKAPSFEPDPAPTASPADLSRRISTILRLSASIRVFTARWRLIKAKLRELLDLLAAAEGCGEEGLEVRSAMAAAGEALEECGKLAGLCAELRFCGKLLMQSDLDVVLGKLDGHVKALARVLSRDGVVCKQAMIVVRPGAGACRDDLRFYVRDLLRRMKIGGVKMKREALVSLNEAMVEDERYVKVVVEDEDLVNVLVRCLDSADSGVQEKCVKVWSLIAGFDKFRCALIGAGAVGPLIKVLESGSELGKEVAIRCLMKLTANSDNAWSVSAQGGVTALLEICSNGDCSGELISLACGVLKNLSEVEEIKRFMVDEGATSVLVELVECDNETAQLGSIDLLQALAYKDEPVRQVIIKEGGILALARVLDLRYSFSQKAREVALRAIDNLCFSSIVTLNSLISNGFLDHLLYLLRNGDVSIQEMALKSVYRLCGVSEEARKAMGEAAFIPELIRFLGAKSFEVRDMASVSLQSMVSVQKNLRQLSQDDRSISLLLQMLDPGEGNAADKMILLSTLLAISRSSNIGRKKIARSPYMKNVEQLAETDLPDAKKLLRKLSSNRIRSIMSEIWHS